MKRGDTEEQKETLSFEQYEELLQFLNKQDRSNDDQKAPIPNCEICDGTIISGALDTYPGWVHYDCKYCPSCTKEWGKCECADSRF